MTTLDAAEIAGFDRLADRWWDLEGPFRPLHKLVPPRIRFIRDEAIRCLGLTPGDPAGPLAGVTVLDVGCGGGLLAEPLSRLGARVTGIDGGAETVAAAARHGEAAGLDIAYRQVAAEDLAAEGARFDIVVASEVVEHVADVPAFLAALATLTRPGGGVALTTLNRTRLSFAVAILGAEYIARVIPRGTHDWKKFLKPHELAAGCRAAGLLPRRTTGLVFDPREGGFRLSERSLAINYAFFADKPAG